METTPMETQVLAEGNDQSNTAARSISSDEVDPSTSETTATREEENDNKPKEQSMDGVATNGASSTDDDLGNDEESSEDSDSSVEDMSTGDCTDRLAKAVSHKEEGNTFFKSGDLEKAGRSYRRGAAALKGLNENNTGDDQVRSLLLSLQTNLSMVCLKQGKHAMSRDVASKALDVDARNVKALYRRAVANRKMGDFDKARTDLKNALLWDPNNTAVKRELISIKKEVDAEKKRQRDAYKSVFSKSSSSLYDDKEEEKKLKQLKKKEKEKADKEALKKRKMRWEDECVSRMSKSEPAITYEDWDKEEKKKEKETKEAAEKEKKKAKQAQEELRRIERLKQVEDKEDDADDSDEEVLKQMNASLRGYKKTSDGRTTSYFHNELTNEAKALIGDIAPKRLGEASSDIKVVPAASSRSGESAWNQAGTWEERDTTEWCTETLKTRLKESMAVSGPCIALVKEVKDVNGEASFAVASGKKKYIFDYSTNLNFEVMNSEAEDDNIIADGSIILHDVSSTVEEGNYDVEISWKKRPPSGDEYCDIISFVQDDFASAVRTSVDNFVRDFNGHYS